MGGFDHVLSPFRMGDRTIRNRVLITGHSVLYGIDGAFSDRHVDYYVERARGGAAIVITEQQAADPVGRNYRAGLKAYDPANMPAWRKLTSGVQAEGALIYAQLFCGGPQGMSTQYMDDWSPLASPSGVRSTQFGEIPAVMSAGDIRELRKSFVRSALNMKEGGFDGIEIHAAHSQLLGSFLSPAFNRRTDAYGGSSENRCRIVVEILEDLAAAVGGGMHVGLRLGASEYLGDAGISEEEGLEQAVFLGNSGLVDFVDMSAGGYFAKSVSVPPMASALPTGFLQDFTTRLRQRLDRNVAIFSVGRITSLAEADRLIEAGACEMVGMTRAHMADPQLIAREVAGERTTHCIGANVCAKRLVGNLPVACVLNPRMGREHVAASGDGPAAVSRRLLVIGAGPAGLKAAATAASAGHHVTVLEALPYPGGRMAVLAQLPFRERWKTAISDLVAQAEAAGVTIILGRTADLAEIRRHQPDLVLLASGSHWDVSGETPYRPARSSITGPSDTGPRRLGLDDAVRATAANPASLGSHIVILDESFDSSAAGLAIMLGEGGARVAIVTPTASYGDHLFQTYELPYFMQRLEDADVTIQGGITLDAALPNGAVTTSSLFSTKMHQLENVDTIVFAAGRKPSAELASELAGAGISYRLIGDALAPRTIEAVLHDGYMAGLQLASETGWQAGE